MSENPIPPSYPPESLSAVSHIPPASVDALKGIEGTVAQLRAEVDAVTDKPRKARLLGEIGEIEERAGDETSASRDYLAAYNADPTFREPLEGLVRLLERRRSLKNLGKIVDALVRVANTPEEKARGLIARAWHLEDVAEDPTGAKASALEATEVGAPDAETATAWLTLELLAAKLGDGPLREQALAERGKRAGDATWRGLILQDVARLAVEAGDVDRALATLEAARAEGNTTTYATTVAIERLARSEPGLAQSDDATRRGLVFAAALEAEAALIQEAIANPERGDALGVPLWLRTTTQLTGAWLRASDTRRVNSELTAAAELLDRALEAVGATVEIPGAPLEPVLINARIRIAEQLGDTKLAADLATLRLRSEKDGVMAAALAMRIAEHAASTGDVPRALEALGRAILSDPGSIPARALQLDILADGSEASLFAAQLEAFAEHLTTDNARGRTFLLAAFIWGIRAHDVPGAKAALSQAGLYGVAPGTLARVARMIASLRDDLGWYEESTKRLIASGAGENELAQLWFDLTRTRYARGDADGARKALRDLGNTPEGAWLGRALEAFLPTEVNTQVPETNVPDPDDRRRASIEEMAGLATDPDLIRGLSVVAAVRAQRAGDKDSARNRLRALAASDPSDPLVAGYLGDLERASGDALRAAAVSAACAAATDDEELAAALLLESGFERWRKDDKAGAIDAFEEASGRSPVAAKAVLAWAARGIEITSLEGRRQSLDRALDGGADIRMIALERFGAELGGGDPEEAGAALATLESGADDDLAVAGALGRLAWHATGEGGSAESDSVRAALATLAAAGPDARSFAAAEKVRLVRASDPAEVVDAARDWFEAGGGLPAAIEWLAATTATNEPARELKARLGVASALQGEAHEEMLASAAMLRVVVEPQVTVPLVAGRSKPIRLMNLELARPGCDPRRRAAVLSDVGDALGEAAQIDALSLAGWSLLAAGESSAAVTAFAKVAGAREDDLASWEGLRAAGDAAQNLEVRATAAEQLGARCADAARGAAFWEQAGLDWLVLEQGERAEAAFDASFARDATRAVAFDRLFRRVREKKDEGDRLLLLTARRLEVADEPTEIAKLFWEQARVLRAKGDTEGALKALENVTMLEPDHVGALALTGEIAIRRGLYDDAAKSLSRLAALPDAPPKNRVTAGVAAVDLYENKLDRHDLALQILLMLHKAKLSSLPVRERLARSAARTGSWREATAILEELMIERPEPEGRIEAARFAMAIYRDRLQQPANARAATVKLLEEAPTDGEGIDMLLATEHDAHTKRRLLERARVGLLGVVQQTPTELPNVRRLANVGRALGDDGLYQTALSTAIALGDHDSQGAPALMALSAKKPKTPQIALTEAVLRNVLAPGDDGPISQLFLLLGPTLAEALGPSLAAVGVTKKEKIDARSGLAVRNEISAWAGAFNIKEFDLYVGGKDPMGVQGIPGEIPTLVLGSAVSAPFSTATRARVARELIAILRGSTVTRSRDDTTIATIVVAACNIAEVRVDAPPYAMLAEVERLISKAISRKTKKMLPEICRAIVAGRADARIWSSRALASHDRVAALASGDVGVVLSDIVGQPLEGIAAAVKGDNRAEELIRFVLSPTYLELRRSLGLEGGS